MDVREQLDSFCEQENITGFEGGEGVDNLKTVLRTIGYGDTFHDPMQEFLEDNPGVVRAIIDWVCKQRVPEWAERLSAVLVDGGNDQ
jgi:hypothetical protein